MTTKVRNKQNEEEPSFYCPIHTEILRDKPGACSLCGMLLAKDNAGEQWKDNSP